VLVCVCVFMEEGLPHKRAPGHDAEWPPIYEAISGRLVFASGSKRFAKLCASLVTALKAVAQAGVLTPSCFLSSAFAFLSSRFSFSSVDLDASSS
jgi:hypothetical protein